MRVYINLVGIIYRDKKEYKETNSKMTNGLASLNSIVWADLVDKANLNFIPLSFYAKQLHTVISL